MTGHPWWEHPLYGLDFETTGPEPLTAIPVEIAFCQVDPDGTVSDSLSGVINPECPIPAEATAIHGIGDEQAARGMPRGAVVQMLAKVLAANVALPEPQPLVIFNAPFDWPILLLEAERHGVALPHGQPIVDPLLLDRWLDKYRKGSRTLSATAARWGVTLEQAHTAEADIVAACQVARAIARAWGPTGRDKHTRFYCQADLFFPAFHRRQRSLYATWRNDCNEYWRARDTRDNGVLRQETGEWPTGPLASDPAYGPQEIAR